MMTIRRKILTAPILMWALIFSVHAPLVASADVKSNSPTATASKSLEQSIDSEPMAQLISHRELMALTPVKRAVYLEGVRQIILELEVLKEARNNSAQKKKQLNAFLQLLNAFISDAQAGSCPAGMSEKRFRNTLFARQATFCSYDLVAPARCRPGTTPVKTSAGDRVVKCASDGSLQLLRGSNPEAYASLKRFSPALPSDPRPRQTSSGDLALRRLADRSGNSRGFAFEDVTPARNQTRTPRLSSRAPARISSDQAPVEAEVEGAATLADLEAETPLDTALCIGPSPSAGMINDDAGKTINAQRRQELLVTAPRDIPDYPASCSDTSVAKVRDLFLRSGDANERGCFYGGNVSAYAGGRKSSGNCEPVNDFCLTRDASGQCADKSTVNYMKCENDEIICNPMVYGIKEGSTRQNPQPICVSKAENATARCNDVAKKYNMADTDFYYSIDPSENVAGMEDAWNRFAAQFNTMCSTSELSRRYFCRECHIIRYRLARLDFLVRNPAVLTACGTAAPITSRAPAATAAPAQPPPALAPAAAPAGTSQ